VRAPQNPRGELAEIAARLGAEAARAQRPPVAVRAFPERFSGRYQVRGPVLRSVDRAVIDRYGRPARDEIVANMPEPYAEDFHNDSINALVAYDLEALDVFLELATTLVVRDPAKWREFGRESIDGELNNVVRTLLRPAPDLASVVRRGVTIWARLFSFGSWRVATTATGKVTLHIGEVDPASAALRLWLLGVVEQTARRALSTSLTLTVVQGEAAFAPDLVCEIG
jgi:serine/threonine-protein kinase